MDIQSIIESVEMDVADDESIGIRAQYEFDGIPAVGDVIDHQSSVWDDGIETDELLPGVSALRARDARLISGYSGEIVLVLAAWDTRPGQDAGEIVMCQPRVLAVVRR